MNTSNTNENPSVSTFDNINPPENSKLKNLADLIWPIKKVELPKFLSIASLMFCILFIQNVIRAVKDSVVNTLIGAESVSFLKFWGVMPAAVLFSALYVKLINRFKPETLFYAIISSFIFFFALFGFVIYPFHDYIQLDKHQANILIESYPHFKWFILILSNWGLSLFYVIAEIWPNAAFTLLFWQFVNSITTIDESKRFYTLFGLIGQTGLYFSSELLLRQKDIGSFLAKLLSLDNPSSISMMFVMSVVVFLGVLSLVIFKYINKDILNNQGDEVIKFKAKKQHMSIVESFKMAFSSRYIMLIAVMLISYGFAINLVEAPWKAKAVKVYTNPEDYLAFVGSYLRWTAILTLSFVVLGSNIVRWLGWTATAIITPLLLFITGMIFFVATNFDLEIITSICIWLAMDPIVLAISVGALQNIITKSSKYTLFDSTKEMSYVPLDDELKTRGKAAVDVIGIKLGKSAGAFLQVALLVLMPTSTFDSISIYLMVAFTIVCLIWLYTVWQLGREYEKLVAQKTNTTL